MLRTSCSLSATPQATGTTHGRKRPPVVKVRTIPSHQQMVTTTTATKKGNTIVASSLLVVVFSKTKLDPKQLPLLGSGTISW